MRKILYVVTVAVGAVCLLAMPAAADWQPGDGHKMHFPQLPDEAGWDVNATFPIVLADDWECSDTGLITDLHFWGSWRDVTGDNIGDVGNILWFVISIHDDIPAEQSSTGYSMPGEQLRYWEIWDFIPVAIDPPTTEGWYDPSEDPPIIIPDDHQTYFQYNIFDIPTLVQDPFVQTGGRIYWLNISAVVEEAPGEPQPIWGWKSSIDHWNDDAVWTNMNVVPPYWTDIFEPTDPIFNGFWVTFNPDGTFGGGGGTDYYGEGWYYYPESEWWNIWFYDHPFTYERSKEIVYTFYVMKVEPEMDSYVEFAVNWSNDIWSLEGNPPGERRPPLPTDPEADMFIEREIIFAGQNYEGMQELKYVIRDYNPEWVSVDVRGYNVVITDGVIGHSCMQSLDLSFVITGEGEELGACCYYDPTGLGDLLCAVVTEDECINTLSGVYQGDGTLCQGMEACCLQDGTCVNADALCCVNELGGTPQGPGTICTAPEACCMPDGSCDDLDPICCLDQGGTPQGPGTACSAPEPCCLNGGTDCQMYDPLCCDEMGGVPSTLGAQTCLGDNDGDGFDDACVEPSAVPKWLQRPDLMPTGMDVSDYHQPLIPQYPPYLLADDFLCEETGPLREIHIWGSWYHDFLPMGNPEAVTFILSIHSDIPANQNPYGEYSMPGEVLWWGELPFEVGLYADDLIEGWFEPPEYYDEVGDTKCWEYIFYLEPDMFTQMGTPQEPVIYWLDLQAIPTDPEAFFGWKTSLDHWNDDACWIWSREPVNPEDLPWYELRYPPGHPFMGQSVDLAFAIYAEGDTCAQQTPGDANTDGTIDGLDVVFLTAFMNGTGPAPSPLANGDPDGDCDIDWGDVLYLTSYVYSGGTPPVDCTCQNPNTWCCINIRGNANGDPLDKVNVSDVTYLTTFLFGIPLGPPPPCWEEGNANGDVTEKVNVSDVSYLLDYLFGIPTGPAPKPCPYP
jgi:hypothetical protein